MRYARENSLGSVEVALVEFDFVRNRAGPNRRGVQTFRNQLLPWAVEPRRAINDGEMVGNLFVTRVEFVRLLQIGQCIVPATLFRGNLPRNPKSLGVVR